MIRFIRILAIALVAVAAANVATAVPLVLTFEGLQDFEQILGFYNGGFGSLGSGPGPDYDIVFGDSALALIDADDGGSGNFANEPSPDTIAFFLSEGSLIMNVLGGFDTGFSFFYTSAAEGSVTVYGGFGGTGPVLGTLPLAINYTVCGAPGDPTGGFACWDPIGVAFAGTALSVSFAGAANQTGFDNITLNSDVPGGVPEPGTLLMMGSGLLLLAGLRRARRR